MFTMADLKEMGPFLAILVMLVFEAAMMAALYASIVFTGAVLKRVFKPIDFSPEKE